MTELYLPHELIIQILLRLPVKSVIRFKSVCKSWFSLISDPHFANSHFDITAATTTHKILFISKSTPETLSIDFEALFNDDSASLNLNFLRPKTYLDLEIKGSCRGFIFLRCSSEFHLWNPSTGAHKRIPLSPNDFYLNFYGFGYDQSTDDYLLFSMSNDTNFDATISSHLEIFSLRANMWKEIEGTHIPYTNDAVPELGLLFNGAIHWIAYLGDSAEDVIVAFDLMQRKLLEMHLPEEFDGEPEYSDLWVFGEFLGLSTMNYYNNTFQIWVMREREYNVHLSWTQTHVLSMDGIPARHFSPLCSTKSGDIVGTDNDSTILWKCNDKGQLLEYHSYRNEPGRSQVTLYIESLLSLPADNAQT